MVTATPTGEKVQFVSMTKAARELKVKPPMLTYYVKVFEATPHMFPGDSRRRYLTAEDVKRMKELLDQRRARRAASEDFTL